MKEECTFPTLVDTETFQHVRSYQVCKNKNADATLEMLHKDFGFLRVVQIWKSQPSQTPRAAWEMFILKP